MSMAVYCLLTDRMLKIVHPEEAGCIYVMWMMIILLAAATDRRWRTSFLLKVVENAIQPRTFVEGSDWSEPGTFGKKWG